VPRPRIEPATTRLRALADLSPDGILGADELGVVRIINAQAAALLGVSADRVVGQPIADVLRLADQEGRSWLDVNRPYQAINIAHGVPEQAWLNASADEVLTTARLVRDEPLGPVVAVAISLRSGRGRARLDRERSDLVATVAHELRSPLTGVKGFVQALLNRWDRLSDDQRKLMLTTVSADADRLARLIAELLDVARIDTDRLQLYPRESSAEVLVTRVVESIRAGTSREIHLSVAAEVPEVFADPDKFTQVVTNLVENAVRHGAGAIRVSLEPLSEPWTGARLTVDDEGTGISAELRRRVFTKFWTTGESGGSGLGMYIIGGLTRAHGGVVTITDAPSGGARVLVDWPAQDMRST
jgi:signal transduction histidine kinase